MKRIKRALSWMLVLCMILSLAPYSASASEITGEDSSAAEAVLTEPETTEEPGLTEEPGNLTGDETTEEQKNEEDSPAVSEENGNEEAPVLEDNTVQTEAASVPAAASLDDEADSVEQTNDIVMDTITKKQSVSLNTSEFYKIFHLDCGRKYFSVDQIEALIDVLAENDYTAMELAVGNEGLRLLLDDMTVTANGTTYASDDVKAGIQAGNAAYYNAETNELTQSEMSAIISYANAKGIAIIPLINTPGHMDAILTAMSELGISDAAYSTSAGTSTRTVDVSNAEAVNFTLALVNKYIQYFAGQGCTIFNMGADEYGNDIQSNPQFAGLINSGKYGDFVNYVNNMAAQIQNAGMVPMAFNDGIYYAQNTSDGTFDANIVVAYWSSGWSGYDVAPASYLAEKGHEIINTHGDWYYVLGKSSIDDTTANISSIPYNSVMESGEMNVAGSMVCLWCDDPSQEYSDANAITQIRTFASSNPAVFERKTVSDSETNISVTAFGLIGVTVSGTNAPEIPGASKVAAYDVKPVTANGDYTGEGVVTIPVPDGWAADRISAFVVETDGSVTTLKASVSDGTATFTAPHFSVVGLAENNPTDYSNTQTVNITAGGSTEVTVEGANYAGTYTTGNESVATVTVTGTDGTEAGTSYDKASVTCDDLISGDSSSWTPTGYYYQVTDNQYYPLYAKRSSSGVIWKDYTYTWGYSTTGSTIDVTQIGNYQKPNSTSSKPSVTVYKQSTTPATPASTTITFKAVGQAGESTTVVIGKTLYTINIIAEDLSNINQTVEFWITNSKVTANGSNSMAINAADGSVYSETGALMSDLVPMTGTRNNNTMVYWKSTYLTSDKKQTDNGADRTQDGVDFKYIRYWNGAWGYSVDGVQWVNIESSAQIVAYYLQETEVTKEVNTYVTDWGETYKSWKDLGGAFHWFWTNYVEDGSKYVFLDYAVVYPDGTQNPSSFPTDNTQFFHFDGCSATNPRVLGAVSFKDSEDYEIWKVTVTDGTSRGYSSASTFSSTYDDSTETVVWTEDMGGSPDVKNLTYTANRTGKLIRVYVRAKAKEDSLTVIYYDEKFNDELYSYNINVAANVDFNNITPQPSAFEGNTQRIDVSGCSIENALGVQQNLETDLTKMPEVVGKYNSALYVYTGSVISDDGKTLYLYYNIDTAVLSPMFVVDYGRSLEFDLSQVVGNSAAVENVTVNGTTNYGTLSYNENTQKFTYTPTKILQNIDVLTINITFVGESSASITNAGVIPATTVNYEEGFAALNGFTGGSTGATLQAAQIAGASKDVYGFDSAVAAEGNTYAVSQAKGSTAAFTFTGTGVDLYVNSNANSGNIAVQIRDANNRLVKVATVQTTSNSTITGNYSNGEQNGLVAASILGLTYGTYSVKITTTNDSAVYFDGFRVYGTIADQKNEYYIKDKEDDPAFLELRDYVLTALNVDSDTSSEELYAQVHGTTDSQLTGIVLNVNSAYDAQSLLENGPKNELFLLPGQSVVFAVNTNRVVQVGLKAVNGTVNYAFNNGATASLSSSTDMFYQVAEKRETAENKTITITNDTSSLGILSVTKVKICDDPNAGFAELSAEDLNDALVSLGITDSEVTEPEEPEVVYADASLTVKVNDAETVLTKNGVVGESAVFTASEIEEAAAALVAEGYELKDAAYSDITVAYGESDTASFTAEEKQQEVKPDNTDNNTDNTPSETTGLLGKIWKAIIGLFGRK